MPAEDIKMRNISSASNLRGEFGVDELHENAAVNYPAAKDSGAYRIQKIL